MDTNTFMGMLLVSGTLQFQMADLSIGGAISLGSAFDSGITPNTTAQERGRTHCLTRLSDTKAVAGIVRDLATDQVSLVAIERSGSTIVDVGDPVDLAAAAAVIGIVAVDRVDDTTVLAVYLEDVGGTPTLSAETFSLSGVTLTSNSE
jgi:hypothetical protein